MDDTNSLYQPTIILAERAASLRAFQSKEDNRFARTLRALECVAHELAAPIAIVGELAGIHHGAALTFVDIDVVVGREHLERILVAAPRHGLSVKRRSPHGWHTLEFSDPEGPVEIHVVPAGEKSPRDPVHAPAIMSPEEL